MTRRTTPVGVLVTALAGLFAMGCTAQTSAVFDALLAPAGDTLSASASDSSVATASTTDSSWWPHPDDGYAMVLPPGWTAVALADGQADALVDAIGASYPELAARIEGVLMTTDARASAVAADPDTSADVAFLLVLAQPTDDRRGHEIKKWVRDQIGTLPGLTDGPYPHDARLPTAKGWAFDYTIEDPDIGQLRVRSYVFRFGSQAYYVNFIASGSATDSSEAIFDAIAASLRFGV
jgi:hypothetical protein